MDIEKLIAQLEKIPLGRMYQASFKALVRLQVYFTGRTQELMLKFRDDAQSAVLKRGGSAGTLDGARGFALQSDLMRMWDDTMTQWQAELQQLRREAAEIPFGVLAVMQERLILPFAAKDLIPDPPVAEATSPQIAKNTQFRGTRLEEAAGEGGVFSPQIRILLEAAAEHLYGDSMNLSGRIWRLDRESRELINNVIQLGIANGDSAWNIAKQLEAALGANEDCPRWTSSRLYGMTASEKSTSTAGLLTGDACDGSGVSYKALRLARTEIQKIHALATDKVMAMQPWVEKEQVTLNPSHQGSDICDETIAKGENGEGIYPKGEVELPLHPNCMCYKKAVLGTDKEFTARLNARLKGEQAWPELDQYAQDIGGEIQSSILPTSAALAVWLLSMELKDWLQ